MIRKCLSLALVGLMLYGVNLQTVFAQAASTNAVEKIKTDIRKRGMGSEFKVVVKMKDGTKLKGYISQILDDSFDLTDAKTKQPTTIPYRDVAEVKKQGWSTAAKIALGVGIGAVAVAAVVGAVAKKGLGSFCPLGCGPLF